MRKRTLHTRNLNLLPLRTVLLTAERAAPARVPIHDSNERLALQLIEKMKTAQAMPNPFAGLIVESPRPMIRKAIREMAESHAG